jgi:drug/metabolite transporter (DMT)-like permease
LVSTSPLFVALFSPILLGESVRSGIRRGLVAAFIGTIIIGLGDACQWEGTLTCPSVTSLLSETAIQGDLLALAGGLSGAGYFLIGRRLRPHVSLLAYITLVYGAAAVVLVGIVAVAGFQLFGYSPLAYVWFTLLALLPQLIGHTSVNWALRYLSAAYVTLTLLGEPIGSTLWAAIFLGETPGALMLVGGILTLLGIAIASRSRGPSEEDARGSDQ